jgi:hypothetical protein
MNFIKDYEKHGKKAGTYVFQGKIIRTIFVHIDPPSSLYEWKGQWIRQEGPKAKPYVYTPPTPEPKAQPYTPYTPPPEFDPDYVPEDEPAFSKSPPPKFPCLFTSRQIEQLIDFRKSVNNKDLAKCTVISTHGPYLDNIVPGAGLFTVKINRKKQGLTNLVVMLSTRTAIEEFERYCYEFYTPETDFWSKGYLIELPEQSYSILWVIAARMGGRTIHF